MRRILKPQFYKGKGSLKAVGVELEYTEEQVLEFRRCAKDPLYFIKNYAKIVSLDKGIVPFIPFPYQERIIHAVHNNRNVVGKLFRQAGKSTIIAAYFAWYVLFNEEKTAVIAANKLSIAVEIFGRVQFIIENLPAWLQQGVVAWNVRSLKLENGSRVIATASSPSAIRGMSANLLLCDEFAHLTPKLAQEFIASVFPTLSSSETSKLIVISTPNGYNHYHKIWKDAEAKLNDFIPVEGNWWEIRSAEWAEEQKKKLGNLVKYRQEIECSFEGSSYTLIDGAKLATLATIPPMFQKDGLEVYIPPIKDRTYVITVDVSRGRHIDNSAMTVTDVTEMPYQACLMYKNSSISVLEFPYLIYNTAKQYNDAFILVEINDIGESVSQTIWNEFEYANMYFTDGVEMTELRGYPGIRTTTKVKALGCSVLKDLIEKDQYLVNSYMAIEELSVFVKKRSSYAAENEEINDDICSTLWLFAWLSKQEVFQDITGNRLREAMTKRKEEYIASQMTPFMYHTGTSDVDQAVASKTLPSREAPNYLTEDQIELLRM